MRGNSLHNSMARDTSEMCDDLGIRCHLEYSTKINGRYLYIDVALWPCDRMVAIEIETSLRHIDLTISKASELGIELIILAPRRKLRHQIENKIKKLYGSTLRKKPVVLLLDELKAILTTKLNRDIAANC